MPGPLPQRAPDGPDEPHGGREMALSAVTSTWVADADIPLQWQVGDARAGRTGSAGWWPGFTVKPHAGCELLQASDGNPDARGSWHVRRHIPSTYQPHHPSRSRGNLKVMASEDTIDLGRCRLRTAVPSRNHRRQSPCRRPPPHHRLDTRQHDGFFRVLRRARSPAQHGSWLNLDQLGDMLTAGGPGRPTPAAGRIPRAEVTRCGNAR